MRFTGIRLLKLLHRIAHMQNLMHKMAPNFGVHHGALRVRHENIHPLILEADHKRLRRLTGRVVIVERHHAENTEQVRRAGRLAPADIGDPGVCNHALQAVRVEVCQKHAPAHALQEAEGVNDVDGVTHGVKAAAVVTILAQDVGSIFQEELGAKEPGDGMNILQEKCHVINESMRVVKDQRRYVFGVRGVPPGRHLCANILGQVGQAPFHLPHDLRKRRAKLEPPFILLLRLLEKPGNRFAAYGQGLLMVEEWVRAHVPIRNHRVCSFGARPIFVSSKEESLVNSSLCNVGQGFVRLVRHVAI
mmetsp:Transcript_597/g.1766  ORF Transcript_597/g.1766 Transcript_597/m.1766 type:complete len:304 (-) Transcript_597:722-1633(-)